MLFTKVVHCNIPLMGKRAKNPDCPRGLLVRLDKENMVVECVASSVPLAFTESVIREMLALIENAQDEIDAKD